jgi:hypothetical protein
LSNINYYEALCKPLKKAMSYNFTDHSASNDAYIHIFSKSFVERVFGFLMPLKLRTRMLGWRAASRALALRLGAEHSALIIDSQDRLFFASQKPA